MFLGVGNLSVTGFVGVGDTTENTATGSTSNWVPSNGSPRLRKPNKRSEAGFLAVTVVSSVKLNLALPAVGLPPGLGNDLKPTAFSWGVWP